MTRRRHIHKVKAIRIELDAVAIGSRIAKARRSCAGTQEWLSRKIGQNPDQKLVANYETGLRIPSLRTLVKIAVELQTQIAERDADDALRPFILSGHINPRDAVDMAVCRNLAKGDPEILAHQMKIRTPYVVPGRTEAPDAPTTHGRSATIANAKHEYGADSSIGKITSAKAYVNLKLHEAGQGSLTGDEANLIVG